MQEAVQAVVYARFIAATDAAGPTFCDKIVAVLDTAVELNREDPSLAAFLVTVRTDIPRHAELQEEVRLRPVIRRRFFSGLVASRHRDGRDPSGRRTGGVRRDLRDDDGPRQRQLG